jgi:hypothetical protein
MKQTKRNHCKMVLLALASVAMLTPAVQAQTISAGLGDLILGFRTANEPGSLVNLEVNLGSVSNLYNAAPGQVIPLTGLSVADLIGTYGSGWHLRTDLYWGAAASWGRTSGSPDGHAPASTMYVTGPNCTPAYKRGTVFAHGTPSANIEALYSGSPGSLNGKTSTANSPTAALVNNTLAGSWTKQDLKSGTTSFAYFNPNICNYMGTNIVVSQLYEVMPTNVSQQASTYLGDLIMTDQGLSFRRATGAPQAACTNLILQADSNCVATVTVDDIDAGSTGYCIALSIDPPGPFNVGVTNVTLTVTDAAGNVNTCTAQVTVQAGAPVVTCGGNVNATAASGCSTTVNFPDPSASASCGKTIASVVCVPASGSSFNVGTNAVTCTATDNMGDTGSCSFNVIVVSSEPPTINCGGNVNANATAGCSTTVNFSTPTATGACGKTIASMVCVPASGSTFNVGTNAVTCTATDSMGATANCSFDVIVRDAAAPSITCPAPIVTNVANAGDTNVVVTYTTPTATDSCPGSVGVVCVPASGSSFPVGVTTVTCTATDAAGNTANCSFTVTVNGAGIGGIIPQVQGLTGDKLTDGRKNSLVNSLTQAQAKLNEYQADPSRAGKLRLACAKLNAFIIRCRAYGRVGIITQAEADALIAAAQAEKTVIGCP